MGVPLHNPLPPLPTTGDVCVFTWRPTQNSFQPAACVQTYWLPLTPLSGSLDPELLNNAVLDALGSITAAFKGVDLDMGDMHCVWRDSGSLYLGGTSEINPYFPPALTSYTAPTQSQLVLRKATAIPFITGRQFFPGVALELIDTNLLWSDAAAALFAPLQSFFSTDQVFESHTFRPAVYSLVYDALFPIIRCDYNRRPAGLYRRSAWGHVSSGSQTFSTTPPAPW